MMALSHGLKILDLLRRMGPRWFTFRIAYTLQRKLGLQRRKFPPFRWNEKPLSTWLKPGIPVSLTEYVAYRKQSAIRFFFQGSEQTLYRPLLKKLIAEREAMLMIEVDKISQGIFTFFSDKAFKVGFPPDWHTNVLTGERLSPQRHWTDIDDLAAGSDIKFVWELSRFSFVFKLVRAYWLTGDNHYAQIFWQLVEDWLERNPPQLGPNWMCGQEATFRILAWIFGLYGFSASDQSTPERQATLIAALAVHAERIEGNLKYARSQRNNHALSEGVGLWTIGLLFPELNQAEHWRNLGWRVINEEMSYQVYEDGSYIQHSLNYARLALHHGIWALRLAGLNSYSIPNVLSNKIEKLVNFLYQLQDDNSGSVPNYGANDGTLVLPLNSCDYQDFRPVLASGYYLIKRALLYPEGPWYEDLLWIFGLEALQAPSRLQPKESLAAEMGGYYTLRGHRAWGFIRCATYKDRPHQADMLHFDFWYQGKNLACDAGTYLYNGSIPWRNGLAGTAVHNTVLVDEQNQMEPGPRFLWYHWTGSHLNYRTFSPKKTLEYFEGEHYGYHRLAHPVTHRRAIFRTLDIIWLVIDDLIGTNHEIHKYDLHWLFNVRDCVVDTVSRRISFNDGNPPLRVWFFVLYQNNCEFKAIRPVENKDIDGWCAPYYGSLRPATSVHVVCKNLVSQRYLTVFVPQTDTSVNYTTDNISIRAPSFLLRVYLSPVGTKAIVSQAEWFDFEQNEAETLANIE